MERKEKRGTRAKEIEMDLGAWLPWQTSARDENKPNWALKLSMDWSMVEIAMASWVRFAIVEL